jgi:hypothetical protein
MPGRRTSVSCSPSTPSSSRSFLSRITSLSSLVPKRICKQSHSSKASPSDFVTPSISEPRPRERRRSRAASCAAKRIYLPTPRLHVPGSSSVPFPSQSIHESSCIQLDLQCTDNSSSSSSSSMDTIGNESIHNTSLFSEASKLILNEPPTPSRHSQVSLSIPIVRYRDRSNTLKSSPRSPVFPLIPRPPPSPISTLPDVPEHHRPLTAPKRNRASDSRAREREIEREKRPSTTDGRLEDRASDSEEIIDKEKTFVRTLRLSAMTPPLSPFSSS